MKKGISLILILTVLVSVYIFLPAAHAEEGERYYVYTANGKSLNLRVEPNKNARVIMKIQYEGRH